LSAANGRLVAQKTLQWLLYAQSQLSCEQLIEAVKNGRSSSLNTSEILDLCGNLIVIDSELNIFRFAHLSVREFLESHTDFTAQQVQPEIAKQCLRISFDSLADQNVSSVRWKQGTIQTYAALYWPIHSYHSRRSMPVDLIEALKRVLGSDSTSAWRFEQWVSLVSSFKSSSIMETKWRLKLRASLGDPPQPIFLIVAFDLVPLMKFFLSLAGIRLETRNQFGLTPLALACNLGHLEIVSLLIRRGVSIDSQTAEQGWRTSDRSWLANPISGAAWHSKDSICELLIDAGADLNVSSKRWPTPLIMVCRRGNVELVEKFIRAGADVNNVTAAHGTALRAAAELGDILLCQLLLKQGADVNLTGGYLGGALEVAAYSGHLEIVRLLVASGATVDMVRSWYGTALQAAAWKGHPDVVEYLLRQGADATLPGGPYGNAFLSAVACGNEDVISKLLAHGVEINTPGGEWGNALASAIHYGPEAIVRLLLRHGADINQAFKYGRRTFTAIDFAAYRGKRHEMEMLINELVNSDQRPDYNKAFIAALSSQFGTEEVVTWLLENGADVNHSTEDGTTPLHLAINLRDTELVEILLRRGARVDAMSRVFGSTFQSLCSPGPFLIELYGGGRCHLQILDLLIQAGFDIRAIGGPLGDALQASAFAGYENVVQHLLNLGAAIVSGVGEFGSPLHAASEEGYDAIVKILLDAGANVNIVVAQKYGTALQAASCRGREPGSLLLGLSSSQRRQYANYVRAIPNRRHMETFHLLLRANANINIQGGQFGNALQAAAYAGNEEAVRALLARNVSVNARGGFYESALQAAACGEAQEWWRIDFPKSEMSENMLLQPEEPEQDRHLTIVALLLNAGADVNATGGFFGTPLQAAAHSYNPAIVHALLDAGAKIVSDGQGYYGNPISAALGFGKALLLDEAPRPDYLTPEAREITDMLIRGIDKTDIVAVCQSVIARETERGNERGLILLKEVLQSILDNRVCDDDEHCLVSLIETLPDADQSDC
jgi:ankyrin repeat protein